MRTVWTSALLVASCTQEYEIAAGPVDVNPEEVTECGFTPISGTQLSSYDCNPVFVGTGEGWGDGFISVGFRTQVVLGHPFFQIWYTARPDEHEWGNYGLGYAISADGTNWDAHPDNPLVASSGGWDKDQMDAVQIVWDDALAEYSLWYQGINLAQNQWGLGVMTSPDGVAWSEFNDGKPILDFTQEFSGVTYCWPLAVTWAADEGYFGYIAGSPGTENVCQIYRFQGDTLAEADSFALGANPAIAAGPDDYDKSGMTSAAVVEFEGTWYMFYVGFQGWEQHDGYQSSRQHSIAMATSTDGITWTKSPDNPLPLSLEAEGLVSAVAAQTVGSRIHLWVTDHYADEGTDAVGYFLFEPTIEPHP